MRGVAVGTGRRLLLLGPLLALPSATFSMRGDWRTATHRATGLAPDPATHREVIVQVYASCTFGWRVHSPCTRGSAKFAGAERYTRHEVIGWRMYGRSTVDYRRWRRMRSGTARPRLVTTFAANAQIRLSRACPPQRLHPYASIYNDGRDPTATRSSRCRSRDSGTRAQPAAARHRQGLSSAGQPVARAPSGTGYLVSIGGIVGLMLAGVEGLEINLFGLVAGIDFRHPALKLPGLGRIPPAT
jgi:hypothetical protein